MTGKKTDRQVYLFGTCLIDLLYPKAGLAAIELLRSQGINVVFPQRQSCCGQPAFNSGYRQEAREVARAQLVCFPNDYPIVVPSASCAGMMKHHWPELFSGDRDEKRARDLAARVYELTEYLVDRLDYQPKDTGDETVVAIHSSCSALREMGVSDRIEKICRSMSKVQVVEQAYKQECCGFGGTFVVKQAEISSAMATEKAAAICQTGAERLISQDCGCLMNIGGILEKQGNGPACQHIAEFLMERTIEPG